MTATPWGAPQPSTGLFRTGDYQGALLLVTPTGYEASIPSQFGDKDAVTCDITVCYHPSDSSKNGEGFKGSRIFNSPIVGSLRNAIGQTVGGRIVLGRSQMGGQKFSLEEVTDENSVQYLQHYWPQHCENYDVDPATGQAIVKARAPQMQGVPDGIRIDENVAQRGAPLRDVSSTPSLPATPPLPPNSPPSF